MRDDVTPPPDRRAPGELESAVLAALWSAGEPRTPAEVQRELGDVVAYSTAATILSRLHTKGVVGRTKRRRSYMHTPVSDEPGMADPARDDRVLLARRRRRPARVVRRHQHYVLSEDPPQGPKGFE